MHLGGRASCDVGLPQREGQSGDGKGQRDPERRVVGRARKVRPVFFPRGGRKRLKRRLPWRELLPVPTRGHQSAADRRRGGRGQGAEVGVEVTDGVPATE